MKRDHLAATERTLMAATRAGRNKTVREPLVVDGGSTGSPSTACPRLTATVKNCSRRTVQPGEVLYLEREDRDESLMQRTKDVFEQTAEIEVIYAHSHAVSNTGTVPSGTSDYTADLPEDLEDNDLIITMCTGGAQEAIDGMESLNVSDETSGGDNVLVNSCIYGWYDDLPEGKDNIYFPTARLLTIHLIVLRGVKRVPSPGSTTELVVANSSEATSSGPGSAHVSHGVIAYETTNNTYALCIEQIGGNGVHSMIGSVFPSPPDVGTGSESVELIAQGASLHNEDPTPPGIGKRSRIFIEKLDGSGSYTPADHYIGVDTELAQRLPTPNATFGTRESDVLILEAADLATSPTPVDTSCSNLLGSDLSQVEPIYDSATDYSKETEAREKLIEGRCRQPLLSLGTVSNGESGTFVTEGFGVAWAYVTDPDHKFLGPPPAESYRKMLLDTPVGDVYGYIGHYHQNLSNDEELSRYMTGWPHILYSQKEPSPIRLIHGWRAHAHKLATEQPSSPKEITLTVTLKKVSGEVLVTDVQTSNTEAESIHLTVKVSGTAVFPVDTPADVVAFSPGHQATSTTIHGDLWQGLMPHSDRPKYTKVTDGATVGPSDSIGRGVVSVDCGLFEYQVTDDRASELADDEVTTDTYVFTEVTGTMLDWPIIHPWVYANPELSEIDEELVPTWPEYPLDNLTPGAAYERDSKTPPAVTDAFDPYLGRELADGDQRIGLQLVTARITGDEPPATDGGCC